MSHWQPACSRTVSHLLHNLALRHAHPELSKGYAKRDKTLRRQHGTKPSATLEPDSSEPEDLIHLLNQVLDGSGLAQISDETWFEVRWSLGEAEATEQLALRLCERAAEVVLHPPLTSSITVYASMAVGRHPLVSATGDWMVVGPDTSALGMWLYHDAAILKARLPESVKLSPLAINFWALGQAVTLIKHQLSEDAFKEITGRLGALWTPVSMSPAIIDGAVRAIAKAHLDQPPGEVGRIAEGLAKRLNSRIDRAARRGFFIPPPQTLEQWLKSYTTGP